MTLGSHQRAVGKSQGHITPRWILDRLGPFDLDPAAAAPRPWDCAARNITEAQDGLARPWRGFVWMNPPFNQYVVGRFVTRLAQHGHGIALLHARLETKWFAQAWESASGFLFLATRLKFCLADGTEQPHNSGAPPVLIAFGKPALARLKASGIGGQLVTAWKRVGDDRRAADLREIKRRPKHVSRSIFRSG